jgi:hypothetical protein
LTALINRVFPAAIGGALVGDRVMGWVLARGVR